MQTPILFQAKSYTATYTSSNKIKYILIAFDSYSSSGNITTATTVSLNKSATLINTTSCTFDGTYRYAMSKYYQLTESTNTITVTWSGLSYNSNSQLLISAFLIT